MVQLKLNIAVKKYKKLGWLNTLINILYPTLVYSKLDKDEKKYTCESSVDDI